MIMTKPSAMRGQNAFAGQRKCPTDKAVALALGATLPLWRQLVSELKRDLNIDVVEWHSGSVKYGWSLRLQRKKRNIVYLSPRFGSFVAAFVIGDKAVAVARKSRLSPDVLRTIAEAKRYAEGTPVRIDVSKPDDLEAVKMLAGIKVEY